MGVQVVWNTNHSFGFGSRSSKAHTFKQFNNQIQSGLKLIWIVGGKNTIISIKASRDLRNTAIAITSQGFQ
jgi:hypothetical protein